jgi:hypothetical protein
MRTGIVVFHFLALVVVCGLLAFLFLHPHSPGLSWCSTLSVVHITSTLSLATMFSGFTLLIWRVRGKEKIIYAFTIVFSFISFLLIALSIVHTGS